MLREFRSLANVNSVKFCEISLRKPIQAALSDSGAAWVAIQVRQRAQLAEEPGVTLPRSRAPLAPVTVGRLAGTQSRVSAARPAAVIAFRAGAG